MFTRLFANVPQSSLGSYPTPRYLTSFSGPTDALELRGPHNIEQKTAQCQPGRADQLLTICSHSTIRLLMQALNLILISNSGIAVIAESISWVFFVFLFFMVNNGNYPAILS